MLHLVGETIDKHRARYGAESGRLVRIIRGVYVSGEADADAVLFDHALRIAAYLYPNTYLCGASAELLAPTPDRRLFLSGRRNARTRLRSLEIVQTRAPDAPETETARMSDPMGGLTVRRSTPGFRYLESFRRRSESAAAMPLDMRTAIAARLVEAAGADAAVAACWRLAEANGWRAEAGRAEAFIASPPREPHARDDEFHVGWHGEAIGVLSFDGTAWHWEQAAAGGASPIRGGPPGRLPPFIESLLPEGWLEKVAKPKSERERVSTGIRYMSNIVVSANAADLRTLPADVLEGRLDTYGKDGVFAGAYEGPFPTFDETLEDRMAQLYASAAMPRMSGVQIKAPMNLARDGVLRPARDRAFTHILKPSPGAGFEELPLVEAECLAAARACGIETADCATVPMPDGLPDALLVERFDIRRGPSDRRRIAMEDLASVRGIAPTQKYEGSVEQAARALRGVSTDPDSDATELFRRAVFSWLVADGDFHLKNMAVLRVVPHGKDEFSSVRLAPAYDVVTTRVFPGLENDDLALPLSGKRNRLSSRDLVRAGVTMGLEAGVARGLVHSLCRLLNAHIDELKPASGRFGRAAEVWRHRIEVTVR